MAFASRHPHGDKVTIYVKFMISSYEFASRNRREVEVLSKLGHTVAVCDVRMLAGTEHEANVTIYHRRKRTNRSALVRRSLSVVDSLRCLRRHLKGWESSCLSCHDISALTIGWVVALMTPRSRRPHLIYDSHEFELGRSRLKPRTKLRMAVIKFWEGFLIRRCAFVISVNDSIADLLYEVHSLDQRPLVVRSTPDNWILDPAAIRARREQFYKALNLPPSTVLAMYHGAVVPNRGIESFLTALVDVPGVAAIILGNGQPAYLAQLGSLVNRLGVTKRVLFHPAVPIAELRHYVAATDIGMVLIQASSESYYLSLPNKLFENIQAMTPVIGSCYPELSRIVEGYRVGLTANPDDPVGIAAALSRIKTKDGPRADFAASLWAAKADLCWEKEQQVLYDAYSELLGTGGPNHP